MESPILASMRGILNEQYRRVRKLEEENETLKDNVEFLHSCLDDRDKSIELMKEENKKLKKEYTRLLKNTIEANELKEENKKLKEENAELKSELSKFRDSFKKYRDYEKEELAESCYDLARENEKLKADYIKLSKIVETTGGYKASYVNELRDKIAKLEFDIEAWKKLKAVREEKIRSLNEKIGKLVMKQ